MASDLPEQLEVTSIVFKDYVDEGLPPLDNFVSTSSTLDVKTLPEGGLLVRHKGRGGVGPARRGTPLAAVCSCHSCMHVPGFLVPPPGWSEH